MSKKIEGEANKTIKKKNLIKKKPIKEMGVAMCVGNSCI